MSCGPGTVTVWFQDSGALFERTCPKCGRFVRVYKTVYVNDRTRNNAVCRVHGRIMMPFLGYY